MSLHISKGSSQVAALSRITAVDRSMVSVVELVAKPPVSVGAGPDTAMGHKIRGLSENDRETFNCNWLVHCLMSKNGDIHAFSDSPTSILPSSKEFHANCPSQSARNPLESLATQMEVFPFKQGRGTNKTPMPMFPPKKIIDIYSPHQPVEASARNDEPTMSCLVLTYFRFISNRPSSGCVGPGIPN